jgi:hypothetical protein
MESFDRSQLVSGLALIYLKKHAHFPERDLRDLISAAGADMSQNSLHKGFLRQLESAHKRARWNWQIQPRASRSVWCGAIDPTTTLAIADLRQRPT